MSADRSIEIILAANTFIAGLGTWLLYKILDDLNSLKIFAGITKSRVSNLDNRLKRVEGSK